MKLSQRNNLDMVLALVGCILSVPAFIYLYEKFHLRFAIIEVVTFFACLTYLLARSKKSPSIKSLVVSPRIYLILNGLFFGLLSYSLIVYCFRVDGVRPLGYFIATAGMATVLVVEILFLRLKKAAIGFVLFKVIIISMSLVWTESLLYPNVLGVDPWYHQWLTTQIVANGHIPSGVAYSSLPGMHLLIAGVISVTHLDYKMATLCSIVVIQVVCNPVFVFLIGKFLYNAKVGLLAALALAVANWHILFSYWVIPNGLAMAFIPVIVYFLLKMRHSKRTICLVVFLAGAMLVTHSVAMVMLVMLLFCIWLGFKVYTKLGNPPVVGTRVFLVISLVVAGVTLCYWSFVSGDMKTLVGLVQTGFGTGITNTISIHDVISPKIDSSIPVGEQVFNNLGFFLFCGLGFIGICASFSKGVIKRHRFAFTFAALLVLAFTFACFAARRFIVLDRWYYFLQILLAIPIGVALIWLGNLWRNKVLNACLVGVLVFAIAFLMIISPQANMDNRTFAPNTIIRNAFTDSELKAINIVADTWDGRIAVDSVYYNMRRFFNDRLVDASQAIVSGNFSSCHDMLVLIRDEIVNEPCKLGQYAPARLTYDPRQALVEQGFVRVYDFGDVSGYVLKPS